MGGDLGAAVKGFRKGMDDELGDKEEKLEPDQIATEKEPSAPAEESVKKTESSS
jgi:Sec-independent protein translocase protein TatA